MFVSSTEVAQLGCRSVTGTSNGHIENRNGEQSETPWEERSSGSQCEVSPASCFEEMTATTSAPARSNKDHVPARSDKRPRVSRLAR